MAKRTFASVTEAPCTCKFLEGQAAHPKLPIRFNAKFNEYYIAGGTTEEDRVEVIIYHCPFCGGAAPESKRGEYFTDVPEQEARRLWTLLGGVKSVEDAFRVLGAPDVDAPYQVPDGWPKQTKERDGKQYEATRYLTYSKLSEVAEVQITVYANNLLEATIAGKFRGAPEPGA
jgi:hypothetical protein